ncbi:Heterodimeric geranylgeranyl pyrophosphate synthase small subunit, chloroplastic [Dendrobium catenatum]|uniref:Heterodimeric geranylgeranyl pyrophosphate synthase small subunit, chloroplastic n=2 Tax=Dendrobium TaxID=37818 RepID=A0A2I0XCR2_9ASPA|nr:Heterodimeric geranylgeranyl pyrophosphate synthase small subunit, chloroplastic [Dendrobium catenatum]QXV24149.1 geranyl pyrophosphate synthase [Dendrobium officinale]
MAAAFVSIPCSFKPAQISAILPRRLSRPKAPNLTLSTTASDQSYFATANADISSHLLRSLPTTLHPSVKTPIHRLLSSSTPPTIAPSLCLAASELVGGDPNLAINAACALQLIHAVRHAHNAVISHHPLTEFSLGTELMTGDALLALGYEMVARTPAGDAEAATRLLKVLMEISKTAAAVAALEEEEREGKLAACAAVCGVILGGGNEEEVERARRLGMFAGKKELAMAEVELGLGFEEVRAGAVRRLLQEILLCHSVTISPERKER